jgi:hypothetical protein
LRNLYGICSQTYQTGFCQQLDDCGPSLLIWWSGLKWHLVSWNPGLKKRSEWKVNTEVVCSTPVHIQVVLDIVLGTWMWAQFLPCPVSVIQFTQSYHCRKESSFKFLIARAISRKWAERPGGNLNRVMNIGWRITFKCLDVLYSRLLCTLTAHTDEHILHSANILRYILQLSKLLYFSYNLISERFFFLYKSTNNLLSLIPITYHSLL